MNINVDRTEVEKSLHFKYNKRTTMKIFQPLIYFELFSQRLRHPKNKPLISHKEALNINEVLFGDGERKYMEEN